MVIDDIEYKGQLCSSSNTLPAKIALPAPRIQPRPVSPPHPRPVPPPPPPPPPPAVTRRPFVRARATPPPVPALSELNSTLLTQLDLNTCRLLSCDFEGLSLGLVSLDGSMMYERTICSRKQHVQLFQLFFFRR